MGKGEAPYDPFKCGENFQGIRYKRDNRAAAGSRITGGINRLSNLDVKNEPTYCSIMNGKCPEKTDGERTYCNYYCQLYTVYNDFKRRSMELEEAE